MSTSDTNSPKAPLPVNNPPKTPLPDNNPPKTPLPEGHVKRPDTKGKCYQCHLSESSTNRKMIATCESVGDTYKPIPNSSIHSVPSWLPGVVDPFWLRFQMSLGVKTKTPE